MTIRVPNHFVELQLPSVQTQQVIAVNYRVSQTNELVRVNCESNLLIFVLKGHKNVGLANECIPVQSGELLFIPKGNYIMNQIVEAEQLQYQSLILSLTDEFLFDFAKEYLQFGSLQQADVIYYKNQCDSQMQMEIGALMHYFFDKGGDVNPQLIKLKATELMLHMVTRDAGKKFLQLLLSISQRGHNSFVDYVMQNGHQPISLEAHAHNMCMSLSTFKRHFQQHFHQSPARWFVDRRMESASNLLLKTGHSIADICFFCGFSNVSHFGKQFKQKYGISPNQFKATQLSRLEQTLN